MASDHRYQLLQEKIRQRDELIEWSENFRVKMGDEINRFLTEKGTSPRTASCRVVDLLRRPQLDFATLIPQIRPLARRVGEIEEARREEIIMAAEILIKYDGYIKRERDLADKQTRLEHLHIPDQFDYLSVTTISTEARQKLDRIRPATIGQASRIPGVSPADINVLLLLIGK